jgi:hypothetical protein
MKKVKSSLVLIILLLIADMLFLSPFLSAQDAVKQSPPMSKGINSILNRSCMPCHSNEGRVMAKSKLNISEWAQYTAEQQQEKADAIYSEVAKGGMPPKSVRESHPENIPTQIQTDSLKTWADSFKAVKK